MKNAGILQKLRLGKKKEGGGVESTGPHTVKIVGERLAKGIDRDTSKEIEVIKYQFDCDDGEKREYTVPVKDKSGELHYLVQRLAEVKEGTIITLEMKREGARNYIQVDVEGEVGTFDAEDEGNEEV